MLAGYWKPRSIVLRRLTATALIALPLITTYAMAGAPGLPGVPQDGADASLRMVGAAAGLIGGLGASGSIVVAADLVSTVKSSLRRHLLVAGLVLFPLITTAAMAGVPKGFGLSQPDLMWQSIVGTMGLGAGLSVQAMVITRGDLRPRAGPTRSVN